MLVGKVYQIVKSSDHLFIDVENFIEGPLPILWFNGGLIALISAARVENDLNYANDLKKIHDDIGRIVYIWDDATQVKKLS